MDMGMDHSDHGGGMGDAMDDGPPPCKISMVFNFYTTDACFLADTWQITSSGMFAGSCIGVILLTMSLEFLRRAVKTYDRYLIRQHEAKYAGAYESPDSGSERPEISKDGALATTQCISIPAFRPNALQQGVRALLHMVQFAVAYFVMLLAMYFNVYIIVCIFIGAFLGSYVFHWERLTDGRPQPSGGRQVTSAAREVTVCCA